MKVLVTHLDKIISFKDKISSILSYSSINGVTDIYFFSNGFIENNIMDVSNLMPVDEINKHIFLSEEDRLKLNLDDYYKMKTDRKDIELIVDDVKIVNWPNGCFVFNNDFYSKRNINEDDEIIYVTNGELFVIEEKFISIDKFNSLLIDVNNNKFFKV